MVSVDVGRYALLVTLAGLAALCTFAQVHIVYTLEELPPVDEAAVASRHPVGDGHLLRILPLGDSITYGHMSSDENGYRLDLRNLLVHTGSPVEFIGSLRNGSNNPDNRHEGWGMHFISQIQSRVVDAGTFNEHPNVVLLHAGTNDVHVEPARQPYDEAPQRLGTLIDVVLAACPDAVLLVAKIIQDDSAQERVDRLNAAVPGLVKARFDNGSKIAVVDHSVVGGTDLAEGLHPNDAGYRRMAAIWFRALRDLPEGWITPPRNKTITVSRRETDPPVMARRVPRLQTEALHVLGKLFRVS